MEYVIVSVLNGAVHGLLLFMVSAGLTLIFGMMGVLNFAHAWFYMLGAYVGYTFTSRLGFWWGLLAAPLATGFCGIFVERYMLRRVHNYGHAHELLLTFGLAFIIEEVIKLFYGDFPVNYQMPAYMKFAAFTLFETNYPFYRLFMGGVALAMFAVLYLLLTRTRVGIIVRAATYRPTTVEALGHNLPVIFMGVFAAGSALAGLAGAIAGAFFPTGPEHGGQFRHAGLRGGRGRRARLAGGRAGRLADDRPLHLVCRRPQLVARRSLRPRRPRCLGARGSAASSRCSWRRSRPACRSCSCCWCC